MPNRRQAMAIGAAALVTARTASANSPSPAVRLDTRLFNFQPDISPAETDSIVSGLKDAAREAGLHGFLVGRNLNATPFPTRFEWMYMAQTPGSGDGDVFARSASALATRCRDQARCELDGPLPRRFVDASGVTVRHVVMFDFKPDAPTDARARNVEAIRAMGRLPMVQAYLVRRNPAFGTSPEQMEWQVVGDFASFADFRAYAEAPDHLALAADFKAHTARVAFIDLRI